MNELKNEKIELTHKCSVCKKKFIWQEESKWFSKRTNSKKLQKEGYKICSKICLEKNNNMVIDVFAF